jgi:tight adherence protein C
VTTLAAAAFVVAGGVVLAGLRLRADPRIMKAVSLLARREGHRRRGPSLDAVGRRLGPRLRRRAQAVLDEAGRPASEADRLLGWKAIGGLGGALLGFSTLGRGGSMEVVLPLVLAPAGFRLPDFVIARRAAAWRGRMEAEVPPLLDVLSLSVAAGLTPRLALERVTELAKGPLGEELRAARHEVSLGASWRQALQRVASRTGLRDIRRLAVTLERSERLGTPVSDHLRRLAREVRAERRAAAEERARRVPVLMLFPLVFLILPAFVLAAVVPAVLVATRGLP